MIQTRISSTFHKQSLLLGALICAGVATYPSHAQTAPAAPASQGTASGADDPPGYTLSVRTQLVTLDVVVNDKDGKPVRGLTRNDFTIYEDKVPQPIVSFDATEPKSGARIQIPIRSTAELDRLEPQAPVSIVVLDELTTRFEDQYFARYSLERYLAKQGETLDEPLMLIARNFHGSQVLLDYTTSRKEVLDALNRHLVGNDVRATDPSSPNDQIVAEFTSLFEIAKATQGHPGHKSLVWIGRGFPSIQRSGTVLDDDPLNAVIEKCTNLLRDARVTLYTIDPAGVSAPEETLDAQGDVILEDPFGSQVDFLKMAIATGGQSLHGRNDVDRLIDTTVQDGQIFYSLGYRPSSEAATDKPKAFRKIHVEVRGQALVATTREGYYRATPEPTLAKEEAGKLSQEDRFDIAAASQGLMVFDGIPLTIDRDETNPDRFNLSLPIASLGLHDDGNKMTGKISLIVLSYDKTGKLVGRKGQVIPMHLLSPQPGETKSRNYRVTTSLDTRSPAARIRFIVLGNSNGKIGADNFFLVDRRTLKDAATGLKPSTSAPKG